MATPERAVDGKARAVKMGTGQTSLLTIARWMAVAGHDYVQISKSTSLSYARCEAIVAEYRPRAEGPKA